jgi:hypothetical protein
MATHLKHGDPSKKEKPDMIFVSLNHTSSNIILDHQYFGPFLNVSSLCINNRHLLWLEKQC